MSIICECVTDVRNRLVLRWCLVLVSGVWCLVSCQLKLNYGLKRKWRTRTFKRLGLRGFGCKYCTGPVSLYVMLGRGGVKFVCNFVCNTSHLIRTEAVCPPNAATRRVVSRKETHYHLLI